MEPTSQVEALVSPLVDSLKDHSRRSRHALTSGLLDPRPREVAEREPSPRPTECRHEKGTPRADLHTPVSPLSFHADIWVNNDEGGSE